MLAALTVALTLITGAPAVSTYSAVVEQLPTDPFLACAVRVVRGDFGLQPEWRLQAYQRGLKAGTTVRGHVWITHYWAAEGRDGQVDSAGNRCTLRTAAANRISRGKYVWVSNPCQMRQVLDCGTHYNDRVAERYGADLWVDLWHTGPKDNYLSEYAVIGE